MRQGHKLFSMSIVSKISKFGILLMLCVLMVLPQAVDAYVNVRGYFRSDGTYVRPHVRSNPNGLKYDNYSWTQNQGLYNKTYGTRGSYWDTPTYITDPYYYEGKALYESGSSGGGYSSTYIPSYNSNTANSVSVPSNAYASGSTWYCNSGYKTIYSGYDKVGCEKVIAPANAYVSGSNWYCNSGYKTIYNGSEKTGCQKVIAPANAYVSGSNWYCNTGYKTIYQGYEKVGCEKVVAPANAYISGSNWYCNNGYRTTYDGWEKVGCEKVIAPPNAYVSGSNWYCNTGYVRSGPSCVLR
jgi:hypothetical protein